MTNLIALVVATAVLVMIPGPNVALIANSARSLLGRYATARNRITGGFLVAAGVGLALARK